MASRKPTSPVLAINGGAGTISRAQMTPRREARYRAALTAAVRAGDAVIDDGGASIDAVLPMVAPAR